MSLFGSNHQVAHTEELDRIANLPRRDLSDRELFDLAMQLTELLRRPTGEQQLRPIQAQALLEIGMVGGLFGIMRVGSGKTLVSLLAPLMRNCVRPLLLVPAKLVEKTKRDQREYSKHWKVPLNLRIVSYELLGRMQSAALLDQYRPDLIIADECHKLRNRKAAVTRRVARWFESTRERLSSV